MWLTTSNRPAFVVCPAVSRVVMRRTKIALASIGAGLSMSKEYRDVFEDLIEKVTHMLFSPYPSFEYFLCMA